MKVVWVGEQGESEGLVALTVSGFSLTFILWFGWHG
ncbi:hypothetical protein L195_g014629 [Trifolium pratense]|uniref:Uncharacterized protein n=1 Tax=Trifolium pratense TaxID=57577 RepID=A0A2K3PRG0_TRIPR|nr:hypothetical protein L195_g014629 [Trifolium pratense]